MAIDPKLFPTVVGTMRLRDADNDGKFVEFECSSNVQNTFSTSENTSQINCGKGGTVTLEKPSVSLACTVMATKNVDLIGLLLNLVVNQITGGERTLIAKVYTPDKNGQIELLERSNDGLGVTDIVVKSADGTTTYVVSDDYTVQIIDNRTIITILSAGDIPDGVKVQISGKIKQNAAKETEINIIQRTKKKFTAEAFGEVEEIIDGEVVKKYVTLLATPVVLDSEYLLEMKDVFRDGDLEGATLNFPVDDAGKVKMRDEII